MKGSPVPSSCRGLPFTYRIEGGTDLKVRLKVDQKRNYVRINNVIGSIKSDNIQMNGLSLVVILMLGLWSN